MQINELVNEIDNLKDWNSRLLEYMDMTEEDMRMILRKQSIELEIVKHLKNMDKMLREAEIF